MTDRLQAVVILLGFLLSDEAILSLKYEVEIRSAHCKLPADVMKTLIQTGRVPGTLTVLDCTL